MTQMVIDTPIPFDIDKSNHAIDGWEVYHASVTRSPEDLYRSVAGQAFYPPVFSLFVATYCLVFGPGVVAEGHYATVIALRNREKKISSLGEGTLPQLLPYPAETHRVQDWEFTIYRLR